MVIGHCTYRIKEGHTVDFYEEVKKSGFFDSCRKEPGNLFYIPYFSAEDPDIFFVTEGWRSPADIKQHEQMPHIADLNAVSEKYLISLTLKYVEADGYIDQRTLTIEEMKNG